MPSLDVGRYIEKCLNSVIDLIMSNIEIIAVAAGFTDETLDILESYTEVDSRIRIIKFPMRSYGAQMNIGLESATGEYIAFWETDDFMPPYALENM